MRQCALTDARLPRDLLLPWEAVRREIQPVSVSEESQDQTAKTDENSQDAPVKPIQEVWMLPEGLDTAEAHREESEQMRSAGLGKQQSKRPAGYRRRSLASHKLIEIMKVPIKKNNKGPRGPRRWHRLIPRHGPHLTQLIDPRDMTWRPDMENFIARKMRRRILAEMEYLQSRAGEEAELAHAYLGIVIVRGEEDLPAREDLVSKTLVQLTSSSGTEAGMDVEGDQSGSEERPNQSEATGAIIRHSGPELLGDDSLRVIREMLGPAISQAEANAAGSEGEEYEIFLTIKEKRVTRRLLQYLWQLRCYLRN